MYTAKPTTAPPPRVVIRKSAGAPASSITPSTSTTALGVTTNANGQRRILFNKNVSITLRTNSNNESQSAPTAINPAPSDLNTPSANGQQTTGSTLPSTIGNNATHQIPQLVPSKKNTNVPQFITRRPVPISSARSNTGAATLTDHRKILEKRPKKQTTTPDAIPRSLLKSATPSHILDADATLAITSAPLITHYQEAIGKYRREIKQLQNEIKNYRRREDNLKNKNKGPALAAASKKSFGQTNAAGKRKIAQKLREAVDVLLETCTPEDRKAALIKAFPDAFAEGANQAKLSTEQTWEFERKFSLHNGIMDKYRKFLNQHNANPFVSRRQINNYREKLRLENPALLNAPLQPDSSPENSEDDEDMNAGNNDDYVPNVVARSAISTNRRPAGTVTTTLRGELYDTNTAISYGQRLVQEQQQQQQQFANQFQVYTARPQIPLQQQYNNLIRQGQAQASPGFQPAAASRPPTTTYSLFSNYY